MSALREEGDETVRAEDAVEIIDCGRASERTKGGFFGPIYEGGMSPFDRFLP